MSDHPASLTTFNATYGALFALLADYPAHLRDRGGACGVWSPREVLAHLSGWLVEADRRYDDYAAGDSEGVRYDFDTFNAASVEARVALNWQETVTELERLHRDFAARAASLSAAQLEDGRHTQWLDALEEDCQEHSAQLRSFAGV